MLPDYVVAIDPGTTESGVCVVRTSDYGPVHFVKIGNANVGAWVFERIQCPYRLVIEMVASYGMPVGKEVFETCVWIGRFIEQLEVPGVGHEFVYRQEEKLCLCHSTKANDATIRRALADRFAYGQPNYGKGTKKEKGWFYGFAADTWSAYAVAVTAIDRDRETGK